MFNVFGFYKFKQLKSLKENKSLLQNYLFKKNIMANLNMDFRNNEVLWNLSISYGYK